MEEVQEKEGCDGQTECGVAAALCTRSLGGAEFRLDGKRVALARDGLKE